MHGAVDSTCSSRRVAGPGRITISQVHGIMGATLGTLKLGASGPRGAGAGLGSRACP